MALVGDDSQIKYKWSIHVRPTSQEQLYKLLLVDYSGLDSSMCVSFWSNSLNSTGIGPSNDRGTSSLTELLTSSEYLTFKSRDFPFFEQIIAEKPTFLPASIQKRVKSSLQSAYISIQASDRHKIKAFFKENYSSLGMIAQQEMWNKERALIGKLRVLVCFKDFASAVRVIKLIKKQQEFEIDSALMCPLRIHPVELIDCLHKMKIGWYQQQNESISTIPAQNYCQIEQWSKNKIIENIFYNYRGKTRLLLTQIGIPHSSIAQGTKLDVRVRHRLPVLLSTTRIRREVFQKGRLDPNSLLKHKKIQKQ